MSDSEVLQIETLAMTGRSAKRLVSCRTSSLRNYYQTLDSYTSGFYTNYMAEGEESRVRGTYGPNYDRMVAVKNKYDPTNLFHLNANVEPTI